MVFFLLFLRISTQLLIPIVMNQEDELDVETEIGNKKRSCVALLTEKQNLYTCDSMSSVINKITKK